MRLIVALEWRSEESIQNENFMIELKIKLLTSLQSIQPDVSSNKQIPCQYVWPLFCYKVGIVGNHVHECRLAVLGRIKDIVEFEQWCGRSGLDNGGGYDEKVKQSKENDNI